MIYPEGKVGSSMTDEKIAQLQASFKEGIERSKKMLGNRWVLHPDNRTQKTQSNRVLETIPKFLLKDQN